MNRKVKNITRRIKFIKNISWQCLEQNIIFIKMYFYKKLYIYIMKKIKNIFFKKCYSKKKIFEENNMINKSYEGSFI